ncbi:hypothetical protein SELMODRAFT_407939 [Selaginella moellendorffii]|uniref:Pentacotripeptide-repeat region of PRORP domain-containing protein n=1 Tax=Selaginella moellendorffii TaxID=88036 RepID=D8R596_SELML|nr:hypothetical protein SELMODRAFT_407939 [Selaginella moellendorffii]
MLLGIALAKSKIKLLDRAALAASSIRRFGANRWDREGDYECDDVDIGRFVELFPSKKIRDAAPPKTLRASRESATVIQLLRSAKKSPAKLDAYLGSHASRLLCKDLQYVLNVFLKNQENDIDLAFKIFELIRKESWYKPSESTYMRLVSFYCRADERKKPMRPILELLNTAQGEGVALSEAMLTEPMRCCILQADFDTCLQFYRLMRSSGCQVHRGLYTYLAKSFSRAGLKEKSFQIFADAPAEQAPSRLEKRERVFFVED